MNLNFTYQPYHFKKSGKEFKNVSIQSSLFGKSFNKKKIKRFQKGNIINNKSIPVPPLWGGGSWKKNLGLTNTKNFE